MNTRRIWETKELFAFSKGSTKGTGTTSRLVFTGAGPELHQKPASPMEPTGLGAQLSLKITGKACGRVGSASASQEHQVPAGQGWALALNQAAMWDKGQ